MRPDSPPDNSTLRNKRRDEMVACPNCQGWMLPLDEYEICKSSEGASLETDAVSFYLFGLWSFIINFISDSFLLKGRQEKLAKQKREILPQFPNSLVCTRCLHIKKRP